MTCNLQVTTSSHLDCRNVEILEPPKSISHAPPDLMTRITSRFHNSEVLKTLFVDFLQQRVSEMLPSHHASSPMDGPDYFVNFPFTNLLLSSTMISRCPILWCVCGSLPHVLPYGWFRSFRELPFHEFDPLLLTNLSVFGSRNTPDLLPPVLLMMDGSDHFGNSLMNLYPYPTTVGPCAQIQRSRSDLLLCTFSPARL
jgi:hypothetical protein